MKMKLNENAAKVNSSDDIENVVFFEHQIMQDDYTLDNDSSFQKHKDLCLIHYRFEKIHFLPGINYESNSFSLKKYLYNFLSIKAIERKNFKVLHNFFNEVNLNYDVKEIWFGNTFWHFYIRKIYPKAVLKMFDHGLTEPMVDIASHEKSYLKKQLGRLSKAFMSFLFTKPPFLIYDERFSILGNEINESNCPYFINSIDPSYSFKYINENFKLNIPSESRAALLLPITVKPWINKPNNIEEHKAYYSDFVRFLEREIFPIFKKENIDTVIIKPQMWKHDFVDELYKILKNKPDFSFIFLPDISPNLPLENFIFMEQVKVLVGALSSGMYYAKKIKNSLISVTYDEWYVEYTMRKYGNTFKDLKELREIFIEENSSSFRCLNPDISLR